MNSSTKDRITTLVWIGGGSGGIWFYAEAHWTVRAALIGVYALGLLTGYGVSEMVAQHVETVDDAVDQKTNGLETEIRNLESELDKRKSQSAQLEFRLEELESRLAALTSETRLAYAAIRVMRS